MAEPTGYTKRGLYSFTPSIQIDEALIAEVQSNVDWSNKQGFIAIDTGTDPGLDHGYPKLPTWGKINDEIVEIVSLVDDPDGAGQTVVLNRGVLDTVPQEHVIGSILWFAGDWIGVDKTEWTVGETVWAKAALVGPSFETPLDKVIPMTMPVVGRAALPYAPGDFKINGLRWPSADQPDSDLVVTWAHRDRLQQTVPSSFIDHTAADVGPEAGTTYTLRFYGEADSLLRTETGLTGTSYTYGQEVADSGLQTGGGADFSVAIDFEDASPINTIAGEVTLTGFNGYLRDNAKAKYGTYSGNYSSTNAAIIAQDYTSYGLGVGTSTEKGAINFTIDAFLFCPTGSPPATSFIFGKGGPGWGSSGRSNADRQGWNCSLSSGKLKFTAGSLQLDGSGGYFAKISTVALPADDAWHHIRVSCTDNVPVFTYDGVVQTMVNVGSGTQDDFSACRMYCSSMPLVIGNSGGLEITGSRFASSHYPSFAQDNVRILEGAALNTASHTVPADLGTSGVDRYNTKVTVELESVREGLTSFQYQSAVITRDIVVVATPGWQSNLSFTTSNYSRTLISVGLSSNWDHALSDFSKASGKWYWEVLFDSGGVDCFLGVVAIPGGNTPSDHLPGTVYGWGWSARYGGYYHNNIGTPPTGVTQAVGDVVGVAIDVDAGEIWFSKNGVWMDSGDPATGVNPAFTSLGSPSIPAFSAEQSNIQVTANWTTAQQVYTAPTGFLAIGESVPEQIPGLVLWLDANDISTLYTDAGKTTAVTSDGDSVGCWADKSAEGNDAVVGANKPTYKTGIIGGKPIVRFVKGANDYLEISDDVSLQFGTGDFTVVYVVEFASLAQGVAKQNTIISKSHIGFESAEYLNNTKGYVGSTGLNAGATTLATSTGYIINLERTSGVCETRLNGALDATTNASGSASSAGTAVNIGVRPGGNASDLGFDGDLAEVCVYDNAISESDRLVLVGHLKTKYGIT